MEKGSITFITGGVRSGKSSFAEKIAEQEALRTSGSLHYIATATVSDSEMEERIARHQRDRAESKRLWQTWEQPTNMEALDESFTKKDIILLDCLTALLTNELFSQQQPWQASFLEDMLQRIVSGLKTIGHHCHRFIIVSNEVLFDSIPHNDLVYTYCKLIGQLHQRIVQIADYAYLVESGIPLLMKGQTE